ncbi:MAG: PIG-L family deacetylase, partial [Bacteroidales bacterium]|nr:PIG-L family deacetylase [Bacteroidales bacterium]
MRHFSLPVDGGLRLDNVPPDILHAGDKIYTDVFETSAEASAVVARKVVEAIAEFEASKPARLFKLGLTTGSTPITLYGELREICRRGEVSFRGVEVFSIDEYYPIAGDSPQSRNVRLHTELLDHIDILPENVHIPDGTVPREALHDYCTAYDRMAREMDLLVIGVGEQGQVGFNESGSGEQTRTRSVLLSYKSRQRQARNFNGEMSLTPKMALTMGVRTMMSARKVFLMAWGEPKAAVVRRIVEGAEVSSDCPASFFQHHASVRMFVDKGAARELTREVAPWVLGPCEWTPKFRRKAVVWLCQKVGKPILKLTLQDYLDNSLEELVEQCGPFDKINIDVFNDLQHAITGWPGGKPNADDSTRPVPSKPFPKTVLVLSPHPDDDVISMGGTLIRLAHQGHNVHVAYQTSGDLAVHDDVVMQQMEAAAQLGFGDRREEVAALIASKRQGDPEQPALLSLKAAIRRSEALSACKSFGLPLERVHFLNMPFYESGGVRKLPCTQADVDIIKGLMSSLRPDQIYMAGDLADPHGTHRVCTEAALEALAQLRDEGAPWVSSCVVWLYRGAWMEWEVGMVDMAVPLSPDEVIEKRHAIYHHLSQKDIVPFPGD